MKKIFINCLIFVMLSITFFCNKVDTGTTAEEPLDESTTVTVWTEKTEVFMEYPALLTGQETVFVIHFTNLKDFSAVTHGKLTCVFNKQDGKSVTVTSEAPDFPGIFRPAVKFEEAGNYVMELNLNSPQVEDMVLVKDVFVFKKKEDVRNSDATSNEETITYLKEQQWKIDFKTEEVKKYVLQNSIYAVGEILYTPLKHAEVPAPVDGVIYPAHNSGLPSIGTRLKQGDVITVISPPPQIKNSLISIRSEFILAKAEFERAERLFRKSAIPQKRLTDAKIKFDVTKAALNSVVQHTGCSIEEVCESIDLKFNLTAPISGILESIHFSLGENIKAGQKLFTITNPDELLLKVNVPVSRLAKIQSTSNASFTVDGYDTEFEIKTLNGKLISIGSSVDEKSRTVPVLFSFRNPENRLKIGMFAQVSLKIGEQFETLAVPQSAVFDDNGTSTAYVHIEGESFAKRILKTGTADRGLIQINSGLAAGERVVTIGGYQVKLASLSSVVPAGHGHSH